MREIGLCLSRHKPFVFSRAFLVKELQIRNSMILLISAGRRCSWMRISEDSSTKAAVHELMNRRCVRTTFVRKADSQNGSALTFDVPKAVLMLWLIFAILLVLWLIGWGFHVAGNLIHVLLVLALIVAVINLVMGRRSV